MKKTISAVALAGLFVAGTAYGSGYRIPEQSIDSTGKSGANIASATNADTTYFNPANMSWVEDKGMVEVDLTYIHLTAVDYEDNRSPMMDGTSEKENFLLPTIFAVSPDYSGFRVGFSVTTPYGLAKRWDDAFARKFSEKFELKTFDINPTVSYKINDMVSIAGGVRMLYSQADAVMNASPDAYISIDADSIDWGWNAALSVKPTEESNISVTYRSHIDISLDGDGYVMAGNGAMAMNTGMESDSFPAPAVLAVSGAYTFDKLTVELTYDRTFWSEYDSMDVQFDQADAVWGGVFSFPRAKDWEDSNAYRIGLTYAMSDTMDLLCGFAYDENPVPDSSLDFSLPDSDAYLFSVGARFQVAENIEVGVSALYDYKEDREVNNGTLNGEFTNSRAILLSAGLQYTF